MFPVVCTRGKNKQKLRKKERMRMDASGHSANQLGLAQGVFEMPREEIWVKTKSNRVSARSRFSWRSPKQETAVVKTSEQRSSPRNRISQPTMYWREMTCMTFTSRNYASNFIKQYQVIDFPVEIQLWQSARLHPVVCPDR